MTRQENQSTQRKTLAPGFEPGPQLFKRWITLSTGQITIHWIAQLVSVTLIRWIVIYPVDSAIQLLNWGVGYIGLSERHWCSLLAPERDNSKAPVCSIKHLLFPSTADINRSFGTPIHAIQDRITAHIPRPPLSQHLHLHLRQNVGLGEG